MHKPALAFVITFGDGGGITEPRKRFFFHGVLFFDDFDDGRFIPVAKFVFLFLACTDKQDRHLLRWKGGQKTQRHSRFYEQKITVVSSLQSMRNCAFVFFSSLHISSCAMMSSTYL